jgi:mRNA-degrading endonuclease YafQ of YafQ-DinJ toxin-antitoxin module
MECRDALDMRLIFQRRGDTLEFHFYGSHSEVKAFFRNRR